MAEVNLKDILNPSGKEIAFNYKKLWAFLISCVQETMVSGVDTDSVMTKTDIVDYLFQLVLVFDYDTGQLVSNFKQSDGSRTAVDTIRGFAVKNTDTRYELIKGQYYYDNDVAPKRDIYSVLNEFIDLSINRTFTSKLIQEYLSLALIDDVYIEGHTAYNDTTITPSPDGISISSFELTKNFIDEGSVQIYADGVTIIDNGEGGLSDGGTINYLTGEFTLTSTPSSISADYYYLENTKFNDSTSGDSDIVIVNFWYFLLIIGNFLINNDFHITYSLNSDNISYHNISSFVVPPESDIYAFLPDTSGVNQIGKTVDDCNLSLTDYYGDSNDQDIVYYSDVDTLYPLSYSGITTALNTDLTKRDFQNTKEELVNFIGKYYPEIWNDFYDSSPGTVFLDILAYINDIIQNYTDRLQRESYPMTSEIPSNIRDWAYFAGIGIPSAVPATTQITFQVELGSAISPGDKIIVFPKMDLRNEQYYELEKGGLTFIYFTADATDNEIEIEDTYSGNFVFTLTMKEGTFYKDTFSATGGDFEEFVTTNTAVASSNFRVFVDGVEKKIVTNFELLEANQSDADGVYSFTDDGKLTITFGNTSLGYQPSPGDTIDLCYLSTSGGAGNSLIKDAFVDEEVAVEIDRSGTISEKTATVIRNSPSGGGSSVELSNNDMYLISLLMQSGKELVTEDNYNSFIALFNGKNGGNLKGRAFLYQYDEQANIITIPLLIPSGEYSYSEFNLIQSSTGLEYPAVISELMDEIDNKKMITDRVFAVSGVVQQLKFKMDLELSQYLPRKEIETQIKEILQKYFGGLDFSNTGKLSDLYYEIETLLRQYDAKNQLQNFVKVYWQYATEAYPTDPWREDTSIEFDYDELTTDQQNKIKQVFGNNETIARNQGDLITLFGIKQSNVQFNTQVLGYHKKRLLAQEAI